jgi:hypothetical protein
VLKRVFVVLLVLALAVGGYALWRELHGLKADLKAIDEQAKTTIAAKETANQVLTAENVTLRAKDAAAEVEKARLRSDLAAKTAENDKLRADLKTAPPETVLVATQKWLSTQDIWLRANAANQVEAIFSLAAFRLNADALADREFLKFTLVPSLQEQLRISEGQNATKAVIISNQGIQIANHTAIEGEKDKQIAGRDATIGALKKANLWKEARDVGIGILIDRVLTIIFNR